MIPAAAKSVSNGARKYRRGMLFPSGVVWCKSFQRTSIASQRHEAPKGMQMTEHIKVGQDGAVLEIIFARPEKKNALSNAMYRAATEALERAHSDSEIRVVLFGAEGDAFTAGNDIADF